MEVTESIFIQSKYQFNYHTLKVANEDKQERSIWNFPICSGKERIKNKTEHKITF